MILHVSSVTDAVGGNVQVAFKVLEALPPAPAGAKAPAGSAQPYPGFKVLSSFAITVPAADASAAYARGSRFDLKAI